MDTQTTMTTPIGDMPVNADSMRTLAEQLSYYMLRCAELEAELHCNEETDKPEHIRQHTLYLTQTEQAVLIRALNELMDIHRKNGNYDMARPYEAILENIYQKIAESRDGCISISVFGGFYEGTKFALKRIINGKTSDSFLAECLLRRLG